MGLPRSAKCYFSNIEGKINWSNPIVGALKGLLSYFYKKEFFDFDSSCFKIIGSYFPIVLSKSDINTCSCNNVAFFENLLFSFGAYINMWHVNKTNKDIDHLKKILLKGAFNIGVQFSPIIGILKKNNKVKILYLFEYLDEKKEFSGLEICENSSTKDFIYTVETLKDFDEITYLSCDFPSVPLSLDFLLKRGIHNSINKIKNDSKIICSLEFREFIENLKFVNKKTGINLESYDFMMLKNIEESL